MIRFSKRQTLTAVWLKWPSEISQIWKIWFRFWNRLSFKHLPGTSKLWVTNQTVYVKIDDKYLIVEGCHFFVQLFPYEKYTVIKKFSTEVGFHAKSQNFLELNPDTDF